MTAGEARQAYENLQLKNPEENIFGKIKRVKNPQVLYCPSGKHHTDIGIASKAQRPRDFLSCNCYNELSPRGQEKWASKVKDQQLHAVAVGRARAKEFEKELEPLERAIRQVDFKAYPGQRAAFNKALELRGRVNLSLTAQGCPREALGYHHLAALHEFLGTEPDEEGNLVQSARKINREAYLPRVEPVNYYANKRYMQSCSVCHKQHDLSKKEHLSCGDSLANATKRKRYLEQMSGKYSRQRGSIERDYKAAFESALLHLERNGAPDPRNLELRRQLTRELEKISRASSFPEVATYRGNRALLHRTRDLLSEEGIPTPFEYSQGIQAEHKKNEVPSGLGKEEGLLLAKLRKTPVKELPLSDLVTLMEAERALSKKEEVWKEKEAKGGVRGFFGMTEEYKETITIPTEKAKELDTYISSMSSSARGAYNVYIEAQALEGDRTAVLKRAEEVYAEVLKKEEAEEDAREKRVEEASNDLFMERLRQVLPGENKLNL